MASRSGRILAAALIGSVSATMARAELPVEPTPSVMQLPAEYPDSYVFINDPNFFGIESGKIVIADVGAENRQYKGTMTAAQFGFFAEGKVRPELYVIETFYSRGERGERTDVLTIYDKQTLSVTGEIVLPGAKRAQILTEIGAFQLSADERFAYVYNFTPAASVTVVDLVARKVVTDIDIPGCTHAFALKAGGFASLCGNGAATSTMLDENGKKAGQKMSAPFVDIDNSPMFTRPAIIDNVAYFPTYDGRMQPVDFSGSEAVPGESWEIEPAPVVEKSGFFKKLPLVGKGGKSAKRLPSGWQLMSKDDAGRLYVIMRKTETIDDHDFGGDVVYVIDPVSHDIVNKLKLRGESQIIEVTKGDDPYLVAVNLDSTIDVFKANTGEFVRNIGDNIVITPFAVSAER
ncbi:MAG: amine dehydrogenase large subunit [Parvularculaceae bacterium]